MEAIAIHKNARTSAQKARLVADQVRGLPAAQAVYTLQFSPRKAAAIILKVLKSAMANAENNVGFKRIRARAKGRADRITKRTSHITVVVAAKA